MLTTPWARPLLAARLAADTQLSRAVHLPATERARIHLELLNVATAVDDGRLAGSDAVDAFAAIRDRLVERAPAPEASAVSS
jgi:hypothetical protein